ncbi:MAG: type II secretion system F family protein, partial [Burkholderiales bacterium]
DELAAQTKRVVLYPAIISVIMIGVVLFLMIYLVPQMVGFIKNMGQEIPIYTKVLIAVSNFFVAYWYLVIALPIIGGATLAYLIRNNPRVRYRVDGLILRIPLLGTTLRKIILARFASVFALMYASGITIIDAMKSAEEAAGNKVMEEGLRQAGQQIAEGKTVTAAFQDVGIFPPLVVRMLRVGENTGRLDTALLNVNYFYTREVRENVARMQVLIEPALILVLGGVLFWVIVSVLGPIYDVFTKLKI